jgi:hypothetical protein
MPRRHMGEWRYSSPILNSTLDGDEISQEWVPGPGDSRGVTYPGVLKLTEMLVTAWC